MHDDALDIGDVIVVLKRSLQETGLFAKVRYPRSIVVGEHLVAEDCVGDLRCIHEVHLKQASLCIA